MTRSRGNGKEVAIVLSGGGARAAYQVGLLRCIGEMLPDYRFPIVLGVSAGAVNAMYLASHPQGMLAASQGLDKLWSDLRVSDVFKSGGFSLSRSFLRWARRLVSGGRAVGGDVRALLDTSPLDDLLRRELRAPDGAISGVTANLAAGYLKAAALITLNYTTGETITWLEGRDIEAWDRPGRRAIHADLRVDHVMASAALPLLFPAVKLEDGWHGDGGIRLAAPLSPAVHLGASRILAVSTRFRRGTDTPELPTSQYPPPAQILGKLLNAIFLDVLDQDAQRLEHINELLAELPEDKRAGMRPIDILVLRPSVDLGRLAADYEAELPRGFRFVTRGLGTRETKSPDFLSLLMFQPEYLRRLIEIGEADARERADELVALLTGE